MGAYSACKALVVGIGRYADPQYDLSYARSDAEAIAELLDNEFGFDQVWELYDKDATRQNVIQYFEQDLQRMDEDDGLLIFFAGHGITVTSAIGDNRGFLVPHDGDPKEPYSNLSLTSIRDDYLPMIPAKHVFLIVDSCYGGLALRDVVTAEEPRGIDDAVLSELTRRDHKVRQVLAAGMKDQKVLDGGLFGHSVFTGRLIEVLREADPHITADHVGVHVRERVARDSLDRKHHQTPRFGYLSGSDGTFVFSRRWKQAAEVDPEVLTEYRLARKLIDKGEAKGALDVVLEGLKKEPLSYDLRTLRRAITETLAEEAAIREGEKQQLNEVRVARLLKDAARYSSEGDSTSAAACLREANSIIPHGKAAAQLERLEIQQATSGQSLSLQLRGLFSRVAEAEQAETFETAVELYEEILRLYPGNRRALQALEPLRNKHARQKRLNILNDLCSTFLMRQNKAKSTVYEILADCREYKDLAMDAEYDVTTQDLARARLELAHARKQSRMARRLLAIWSSNESIEEAQGALLNSKDDRASIIDWAYSDLELERQFARAVLPGIEDAERDLAAWLSEINDVIASSKRQKNDMRREHQEEVVMRAKRIRRKWRRERASKESEIRLDWERRREEYVEATTANRSKGLLSRFKRWYITVKGSPTEYDLQVALEVGLPSEQELKLSLESIPRFRFRKCLKWPEIPKQCTRFLGSRCLDIIPTDIPKWMKPDELQAAVKKAVKRADPLPGVPRVDGDSLGRYAQKMEVVVKSEGDRLEKLLITASIAIKTLLWESKRQEVGVAGLGAFGVSETDHVTLIMSTSRSSSSQWLWDELYKRKVSRDDVRTVVELLAGIPNSSAKGEPIELPGLGVFALDRDTQNTVQFFGYSLTRSLRYDG